MIDISSNLTSHQQPFIIDGLTVFILACFVGYHVVWRVTPALHSPLMAITNAISSVIIVGAIIAVAGSKVAYPTHSFAVMMRTFGEGYISLATGFLAVVLASINIFGGFIITWRMLSMFRKKDKA